MMKVILYSDGSSRGNPGPGGYGTVLEYVDGTGTKHTREYFQGYKRTTNNRMEIMGVIVGLEALIKPCEVCVISDSQYVVKAFNENWINGWKAKGWVTSGNSSVKNKDLWIRLLKAMEPHQVTFQWIKGHAGHPQNERCDALAVEAAERGNLLVDEGFSEKKND